MARKSLKQWLTAANGWQRIWFVGSVVCFLYFIVIYPLTESDKGRSFRYEMLWAAEKEMKNPICASYMSSDFDKLISPEFSTDGSTCYHIYSHRQFSEDKKPITAEIYQQHFQSREREMWLMFIGIGALISSFWVAVVYAVGVVVSWVIKGFKKSEQ